MRRDQGVSLTEYAVILTAFAIALVGVVSYFGQGVVLKLYNIIQSGWPT